MKSMARDEREQNQLQQNNDSDATQPRGNASKSHDTFQIRSHDFPEKSFREGKKKTGVHKGVTIVTVWKPMQEQCTGYTVRHLELVKHTHDLR